jgi:hypothetical protein
MYLLISIGIGFALMFPLGWIFGAMNWPVFHSWGLRQLNQFSNVTELCSAVQASHPQRHSGNVANTAIRH